MLVIHFGWVGIEVGFIAIIIIIIIIIKNCWLYVLNVWISHACRWWYIIPVTFLLGLHCSSAPFADRDRLKQNGVWINKSIWVKKLGVINHTYDFHRYTYPKIAIYYPAFHDAALSTCVGNANIFRTRPMPWLLIPRILGSPGHHYWLQCNHISILHGGGDIFMGEEISEYIYIYICMYK